jgi:hypothetical protein
LKFASIYIVGYVVFLIGVVAALWKSGLLQQIGAGWTAIGLLIAVGIGIMLSIGSGKSIEIDRE